MINGALPSGEGESAREAQAGGRGRISHVYSRKYHVYSRKYSGLSVLDAKQQCLQCKLAAERSEADPRLQNSLFSQSPVE